MSETKLETFGLERAAGAVTVGYCLVHVGVTFYVFGDDPTTFLAGAAILVLVGPLCYLALLRGWRAELADDA